MENTILKTSAQKTFLTTLNTMMWKLLKTFYINVYPPSRFTMRVKVERIKVQLHLCECPHERYLKEQELEYYQNQLDGTVKCY